MVSSSSQTSLTLTEFRELFNDVSNWGRWGPDDNLGTLNLLTPAGVIAAARLVQTGRRISLGLALNTVADIENPRPAWHHMTKLHDVVADGPVRFARDFIGADYHGDSHSHIDALCHVSFDGRLYNGHPASQVTSQGAEILDASALSTGIVGRGVLLDIAWLRGVLALEPGETVGPRELEAAERKAGVRVGSGDILLFRTGADERRARRLPNAPHEKDARAGLSVHTAVWMRDRGVAAFLPDGDGETIPSSEVDFRGPMHALQIVAMGMLTADSLDLRELSAVCRTVGRWEFLIVIAPLVIKGGTGSPANPIAVF